MRFLPTNIRKITLVAVFCACAHVARAQDAFDTSPPHLAIIDGSATLDREDVTEPAAIGVPMIPGDRLRTEQGRAELLFPDGSVIDLDEYTTIEIEGPTLLRMTSGRALLFVAGSNSPASAVQFQIDTPVASAQTDGPGEYRVSILGGPSALQTEMAVVRGAGALVTELATMPLGPGQRSVAWDNAAPSRPQLFNSARYDAFDQWAMALRDQRLGSRSQSEQYLPADLRVYGGELDRSGAWDYEAPYGYVWYPTVASEWRPYHDGYWSPVPIYGWTWIGADVWSWPTHHYGRWGYARNRWFWIPDRRWAPAWVSWGGAPGYVSWCALGFDNRPVFSLSVSAGNSYRGWTVLSRDHFGGHRSVRQFAVAPRSLPANVGFVAQAAAPVALPRAVPRRSTATGGQVAGDRRQFPNVFGRSGDRRPDAAVGRQAGGGQAQGHDPRADRQTSITRSPQAVGRQPQTSGQPQRTEQRGTGDRSPAAPRQSQSPSTQTPPQSGDRSSSDAQNRGVSRARPPDGQTPTTASPNESRGNSARPRYVPPSNPQAPAQPIGPATPQASERPRYGTPARRTEAIRPVRPASPDNAGARSPRRSSIPTFTQREQRAAQPRQKRQNDQERSRGQEKRRL